MQGKEQGPGEILDLSGGYWKSFAVHAGVTLDVFTQLKDGELAAIDLARRTGCEPRALAILCNALAALGLLVKRDDAYGLSENSRTFLVQGSPRYMGNIIRHHRNLVPSWAGLAHAVRTGQPQDASREWDGQEREDFLLGMFNLAMGIAPGLAPRLPLAGRQRLLDLGGGPGTYAIQFCLAHPGLSAVIFDLPSTRPFAEQTVRRFGATGRVTFAAGDYHADAVPKGFDAAWLSQILHAEGPEDCRNILGKAVAALDPGGILLVHEFLLDDAMDGPAFPALFSLNMLLQTGHGQSYSEGQIKGMLREAGLSDVRRLDFRGPNDSGIVCGVKG